MANATETGRAGYSPVNVCQWKEGGRQTGAGGQPEPAQKTRSQQQNSVAKFSFPAQVRAMRKPPDSLGLCLFILEKAQQSPYNNLQHVNFCLKPLNNCKFWINCFG